MVDLTRTQIQAIERAVAFPNGFGYVLDFSDRTMGEFFSDEFGIDIYREEYATRGTSKRNHLTAFLEQADTHTALKVLRGLWERREGLLASSLDDVEVKKAAFETHQFQKVIESIEASSDTVASEGIDKFSTDRTLEELVADIDRTLSANKPEVAIGHLHTYCMKKVAHLLKVRGLECTDDEPLHSRFGRYRKALIQENSLHEFADRAMKSSISLLESFNDLRNHRSLAHDNELLRPVEARFVFSSINAILVLIRALEAERYGE